MSKHVQGLRDQALRQELAKREAEVARLREKLADHARLLTEVWPGSAPSSRGQ